MTVAITMPQKWREEFLFDKFQYIEQMKTAADLIVGGCYYHYVGKQVVYAVANEQYFYHKSLPIYASLRGARRRGNLLHRQYAAASLQEIPTSGLRPSSE